MKQTKRSGFVFVLLLSTCWTPRNNKQDMDMMPFRVTIKAVSLTLKYDIRLYASSGKLESNATWDRLLRQEHAWSFVELRNTVFSVGTSCMASH